MNTNMNMELFQDGKKKNQSGSSTRFCFHLRVCLFRSAHFIFQLIQLFFSSHSPRSYIFPYMNAFPLTFLFALQRRVEYRFVTSFHASTVHLYVYVCVCREMHSGEFNRENIIHVYTLHPLLVVKGKFFK